MTKVLLIDANTTPFNEAFPVYPIGLDYLQGALRKQGIETVEILDLTRSGGPLTSADFSSRKKKSLELIGREVKRERWDVIGLSLRNIDSTYPLVEADESLHYYLPALLDYIDCAQTNIGGGTAVVLGGAAFSMIPEVFLEGRPSNFYGIVGPAETAFPRLVKRLVEGHSADRIIKEPAGVIGALQNGDLLQDYFRLPTGESTFGIRTKLGCGQNCGYCPYPLINRSQRLLKDPEDIIDEIAFLDEARKKAGTPQRFQFMFADDIFNRPLEHAKSTLKALLKSGLPVDSWHAYLDPKGIDEEFMELVFETNGWSRYMDFSGTGGEQRAVFFPFDIESGSPRMLKRLGKPHTVDDIRASVDVFKRVAKNRKGRNGLMSAQFGFHLLIGYPGEDEESVRETCGLINETKPAQIALQLGVRIYPRTPLSRETKNRLWRDERELLKPVFSTIEKDLFIDWLRKYVDVSYDRLTQKGAMFLIS